MRNIIRSGLMSNIIWTRQLFLKYTILHWFLEKGVSILDTATNMFNDQLPQNWQHQPQFNFRLKEHQSLSFNFVITIETLIILNFIRHDNIVRSECISYSPCQIPDPGNSTADDCRELVLAYNEVAVDLAKKFLSPILTPLSMDMVIKSKSESESE